MTVFFASRRRHTRFSRDWSSDVCSSDLINLFVIGTGLIGSTLIKQIDEQSESLREDRGVEIRLIGIANSRKMLFDEEGIDLSTWKDQLDTQGEKMDIAHFMRSEEHTSELQSRENLVCRLLLEK